ncbi:MAG: TIGR02452 family protein, partial [Alphaproteobacteria bacterium]|nr:TIGR02452 family protein [Alphaproteobacteria bacterium]
MTHQAFIGNLQLGGPWTSGALTIWPLIGGGAGERDYATLDEALATGRFQVGEVGEAGTVPELKVDNRLDRPVLLLDGEELIGAKQNRVLNLTIMVPANAELTIPVSCVEAGRWRYASRGFRSSGRTQFARGRARKLGQVSFSLRERGQAHASQADVWNEIDGKARRMGVLSDTGAMSDIYRAKEDELASMTAAPSHEGQVGAVFAIAGRIAGVELFERAEIYARLAAKIISSYALDALDTEGLDRRPQIDEPAAFL